MSTIKKKIMTHRKDNHYIGALQILNVGKSSLIYLHLTKNRGDEQIFQLSINFPHNNNYETLFQLLN